MCQKSRDQGQADRSKKACLCILLQRYLPPVESSLFLILFGCISVPRVQSTAPT